MPHGGWGSECTIAEGFGGHHCRPCRADHCWGVHEGSRAGQPDPPPRVPPVPPRARSCVLSQGPASWPASPPSSSSSPSTWAPSGGCQKLGGGHPASTPPLKHTPPAASLSRPPPNPGTSPPREAAGTSWGWLRGRPLPPTFPRRGAPHQGRARSLLPPAGPLSGMCLPPTAEHPSSGPQRPPPQAPWEPLTPLVTPHLNRSPQAPMQLIACPRLPRGPHQTPVGPPQPQWASAAPQIQWEPLTPMAPPPTPVGPPLTLMDPSRSRPPPSPQTQCLAVPPPNQWNPLTPLSPPHTQMTPPAPPDTPDPTPPRNASLGAVTLRELDGLFRASDCRHFNRTESLRCVGGGHGGG